MMLHSIAIGAFIAALVCYLLGYSLESGLLLGSGMLLEGVFCLFSILETMEKLK
jgi:hypothetical protein